MCMGSVVLVSHVCSLRCILGTVVARSLRCDYEHVADVK